MGTLLTVLGWLSAGAVLLATGAVLAFRTRSRVVLTAIRRFNRWFSNPRQMRTAGGPGAYAGVIDHVGRRSGRSYRTPIGIVRADENLVVLLPYGPGTDWVRNVMAAGTATVTHEGDVLDVRDPRLVDREDVAQHLTIADRRVARLFGMDRLLVLPVVATRPLTT